jgi:lysine 2,3-aminomutase
MAITDEFLDKIDTIVNNSFKGDRKNIYFMTHINHYNEITEDLAECVLKIKNHGYSLRNQTVFLNHVNSDFYTLAETFKRMWWAGIAPYYLLQCHNEKGLTHFIAPVHLGKYLTRHLHGWISGTCRPTYSANLEGGGGKVTLTPSGYDIFDEVKEGEKKSSKMAVTVHTWDDKIIKGYEALGRATKEEYVKSRNIMDKFLGRPSIFKPAVIIVNNEGTPIRTTRRRLPNLTNEIKADLLKYNKEEDGMPITNPAAIKDELNEGFKNSKFYKQ